MIKIRVPQRLRATVKKEGRVTVFAESWDEWGQPGAPFDVNLVGVGEFRVARTELLDDLDGGRGYGRWKGRQYLRMTLSRRVV